MPRKRIARACITCRRCGATFQALPSAQRLFCSLTCRYGTLETRFWENVLKTDGCWIWQGEINAHTGYGSLSYKHTPVLAHRVSWELHFGPIPTDRYICHHCDNRACVRPDHLFLGTQAENMQDASRKGRLLTGMAWVAARPHLKLDPETVREIRALAAQGVTQSRLAARFGVNQGQISRIVNGLRWRDPL